MDIGISLPALLMNGSEWTANVSLLARPSAAFILIRIIKPGWASFGLGQYPARIAITPRATMEANIAEVFRRPAVIVFSSRWSVNGTHATEVLRILHCRHGNDDELNHAVCRRETDGSPTSAHGSLTGASSAWLPLIRISTYPAEAVVAAVNAACQTAREKKLQIRSLVVPLNWVERGRLMQQKELRVLHWQADMCVFQWDCVCECACVVTFQQRLTWAFVQNRPRLVSHLTEWMRLSFWVKAHIQGKKEIRQVTWMSWFSFPPHFFFISPLMKI